MTLRSLRPLAVSTLLLAGACDRGGKQAAPPAPPAPAASMRPAQPTDPASDAAASYRLSAAIVPASLSKGSGATLAVEIVMTRPDVHVQAEFPLRLTLKATPGLTIGKSELGHGDAVDPKAKGRRWEVGVAASGRGAQTVEASLRFAVCKETEPAWCVTRNDTVSAGVDVR